MTRLPVLPASYPDGVYVRPHGRYVLILNPDTTTVDLAGTTYFFVTEAQLHKGVAVIAELVREREADPERRIAALTAEVVALKVLQRKPVTRTVIRNDKGLIVGMTDVPD
jgi:hypothetical protein